MVNKCGLVGCNGNYNKNNKCRVFKLPTDAAERQTWINVLPPRKEFVIDPDKFFICERHWSEGYKVHTFPGGRTRPKHPPSVFPQIPKSCMPTPKAQPRSTDVTNVEARQLEHLRKVDGIETFASFNPEKTLRKTYNNVIITRSEKHFVCVFMKEDFTEANISVIVENRQTLTCPVILKAFKNGIRVPLGNFLHPNNGLNSYQMFYDAVRRALNYDLACDPLLEKVVTDLRAHSNTCECCRDNQKGQKLAFLTHQLELLWKKEYTIKDYCFAIESFPNCKYEHLREILVLPSKRKLQEIVSSVNISHVLEKTFKEVKVDQQKNVFLLVDEIKIRPTVSFSGGALSGMAKNNEECRATSMLCVMMRALHGGPSVMVSVTPVHRLTADFQFAVVREAALCVEKAGGIVLGSISDNHKINQLYCKQFPGFSESTGKGEHPLDSQRDWFLLFDTVHLLKCIRNNWITEKTKTLKLNHLRAEFDQVIEVYNAEKGSILKTTTLTQAAVHPSKLQLQNVQHVLKVFSEKVVAALKLKKFDATADFIQTVLNWWNTVNVDRKGQDIRFNDPARAVQVKGSCSLDFYLDLFKKADAGHGPLRVQCFTHDTKRALIQTMAGLKGVCVHLLEQKQFQYVLLRELQSDRLEGEFGVYRQSTGANAFLTSADVFSASKKRLTKHSATYLESLELKPVPQEHTCLDIHVNIEDATSMELCISNIELTDFEESSAAYVAGWLEKKCSKELRFENEDELVSSEAIDFIETVSRGSLAIPHASTFELVRLGLKFMKEARQRACCRDRLLKILKTLAGFCDIDITCTKVYTHLSNVLLHGLHKLDRDQEKETALYQTSLKKARMM